MQGFNKSREPCIILEHMTQFLDTGSQGGVAYSRIPPNCAENLVFRNDLACSLDKKSLYKCDGTKYGVESTCKGPKGCAIEGTNVKCDHHVAELNDPCHVDGNFACAPDKKMLLVCKNNKFHKEKGCRGSCSFTERGDTTEFDCP